MPELVKVIETGADRKQYDALVGELLHLDDLPDEYAKEIHILTLKLVKQKLEGEELENFERWLRTADE